MTRNIAGRSAQRSLLCIACILMLTVFGCQRRTEVIAGEEYSHTGKNDEEFG